MQLTVPPDLESLINKRLSSGGYSGAEDVLRRWLRGLRTRSCLRRTRGSVHWRG